MSNLQPIPVPLSYRWRELRIRFLPAAMFTVVLVSAAFLWKAHVAAPSVIGEVQSVQAEVISIQAGLLTELAAEEFQPVTKGQVLGRLLPNDPEALKASLLAMEMELKLMRARMALDLSRNALNYEQLRLDWMTHRVELAAAKVNLQQAENEFQRVQRLHAEKIASDLERDVAARDQARLLSEVTEKTAVLEQLDTALKRMAALGNGPNPHEKDIVDQVILAQEAKLILLEGPVELKSPMDGMITAVNYRVGEKIMAGQSIVTVSAKRPERIIGYIRQPLTRVPQAGDAVQLRTRSSPRRIAMTEVLRVGPEMQVFSSSLRIRGLDGMQERGLPFLVAIPDGFDVYPGEVVDLVFKN